MVYIKINYSVTDVYISGNGDAPVYIKVSSGDGGASGTVTSVDMTVPTGLTVSGNPITSSGTLAVSLASGYVIPTQATIDGKVPYSGATGNVNLGEYEIKAGQFTLDTSPTGTATVGTTRWNDTIGSTETTLKGGSVVLKNGVDLVARVVNKVTPNATLTKAQYQAVRVTGAQGQRLAVAYAQANNDNNSADTIGLVTETIATNQEGFIMTVGQLEGINTTGSLQGETWADGDVLYLSPTTPGALTNVKPVAPQHIVVIGYVEYAHANNGKIYVKVMNGWELGELHDVNTAGATNGQVLAYNGSIWVPTTNGSGTVTSITASAPLTGGTITSSGSIGITQASGSADGYLSSADWTTFNNKQNALTNPITGSAASGQVAYFTGATTQAGSNNLFWDNANARLGIGTNSPGVAFDINTSQQPIRVRTNNNIEVAQYFGSGLAGAVNYAGFRIIANTNGVPYIGLNTSNSISTYTQGNQRAFFAYWGDDFGFSSIGYGGSSHALAFSTTTGNVKIGGVSDGRSTFTDGGQRLQVQGTTLLNGNTKIGTNSYNDSASTLIVGVNGVGAARGAVANNSNYQDFIFVATQVASGNINSWSFGQRKDTYFGNADGSFQIVGAYVDNTGAGSMVGGGFRVPLICNPNGSVIIAGASANAINGDVAIGTATFGTATELTIGGSKTASSAIARGTLINTTLTAAANNDVLVGLDVNPTFTNGAFTGVSNLAARFQNNVLLTRNINDVSRLTIENTSTGTTAVADIYVKNSVGGAVYQVTSTGYTTTGNVVANMAFFRTDSAISNGMLFVTGGSAAPLTFGVGDTNAMRIFGTTRNVLIQSGGTYTDAGFRLDVNGTARVQGALTGSDVISAATNFRLNNQGFSQVAILDAGGSFAGGYNLTLSGTTPQHNSTGAISGYYYGSGGTIRFYADSSQTAGTNAAERMRLTAAGRLLIGTTTEIAGTEMIVSGTETASSAIARGTLINTTLTASANNDVLVGLDVNPTFTNGAFTGVTNLAARFQNNVQATRSVNGQIAIEAINTNTGTIASSAFNARNSTSSISLGKQSTGYTPYQIIAANDGVIYNSGGNISIYNDTSGGIIKMAAGAAATTQLVIFSNGNVGINQNTDAGFRLDVNGTARVQGKTTFTYKSATNIDSSIVVGDDIGPATGINRSKLVIGNTSGISELIVGQGVTNNLLFNWSYNATAANAYGVLETYGGNNPLVLQSVSGNVLIGTTTNSTFRLDVNGTARVQSSLTAADFRLSALNTAPATASSTGTTGEIRIDANYIYVCTATNTWKRVAIATW